MLAITALLALSQVQPLPPSPSPPPPSPPPRPPLLLLPWQDRVPPFANEHAFAILEAELGRPIGEVYAAFAPEPVAAASLGQVYRAAAG